MSKFRFDLKAKKITREMARVAFNIGTIAVQHTKREVFRDQSWDGRAWAPKKKDDGRPLLNKSGKLISSIRILRYSSKGVRWGSRLSYAGYHNAGTKRIPKRQFLGMDRPLRKRIISEMNKGIKRGLQK